MPAAKASRGPKYLSGFGNEFSSEALPGALPTTQNSPQKVPYNLYAEQLSGSSFTAPRKENLRSWLYRILPSVRHGAFEIYQQALFQSAPLKDGSLTPPTQLRWDPLPLPSKPLDFIDGLVTIAVNGNHSTQTGMATHLYAATASMKNRFFYNSDGEFLFVPQQGRLQLKTEFGVMELGPGEIAVIQRGIKFQVHLPDGSARGYVCENYGQSFRLPDLGPIGSNGLADPRHFLSPLASYEEKRGNFELITKFQGQLWKCAIDHSPLDVVAWHGNYVPYKYDLRLFQVVNTVSFDHPDPSIFTVLTSPSGQAGVANVDFVIFPPRWMVAEHTFRPPYYHRNVMNEYMGLIYGVYDAKEEGFVPGGGSLHNCMSAHGPDASTYEKATEASLAPRYQKDTLAFMFESRYAFQVTSFALQTPLLQKDYLGCWQELRPHFKKK